MEKEKTIHILALTSLIINGISSLVLISIPLIVSLGFKVFEGIYGIALFTLLLLIIGLNIMNFSGFKLIKKNRKKAFWLLLIPNIIFLPLAIGFFIGPTFGIISAFLLRNN